MKKSGSITVFTSLFLAVFLLVYQVLLQSVQIAGGRVQAEAGVEEGLYSVFAGYDRELLKRYHIFMVDGSYGTGVWKPERMYYTVKKGIEDSCRPGGTATGVRGENLWKCSSVSGAITGYTLLSDAHGREFYEQAVDDMKETLGIQGIQLLIEKSGQQKDVFERQEKDGGKIQIEQTINSYEEAKKAAVSKSEEGNEQVTEVPADFVNPIEVIRQLQKKGVLALVLPGNSQISENGFLNGKRLSQRENLTGMGTTFYTEEHAQIYKESLFRAYMMQHLQNYRSEPRDPDALQYQLEYVIGGKNTDRENLKTVVYRLLAAREAANMMYLLGNQKRQLEIHEMALTICAAAGMPALEGVVSLALQAAWAFGESLMDVRQLLAGGKVALVKTDATWLISLEQLARITELLKNGKVQEQNGLTYQEYLGILLLGGKKSVQVERTMDVVEQVIRSLPGKEKFCMDYGVVYLETDMEVTLGGRTFSMRRDYGYAMEEGR